MVELWLPVLVIIGMGFWISQMVRKEIRDDGNDTQGTD
jgi:hypothetical protein